MNPYYLLYYKIYKATYKTNKEVVEWTSMVSLSILVFFNIITILAILNSYIPKNYLSKKAFILGMILIIVINYFIFIYDRKYEKIIKNYSEKKRLNNFFTGAYTLFYVLGSIFIMFYFLRRMS